MQSTFMQGLHAHPPVASVMSEALNGNRHIPLTAPASEITGKNHLETGSSCLKHLSEYEQILILTDEAK